MLNNIFDGNPCTNWNDNVLEAGLLGGFIGGASGAGGYALKSAVAKINVSQKLAQIKAAMSQLPPKGQNTITMAVGAVEKQGVVEIVTASSEPGKYIRPQVQQAVQGTTIVGGEGLHAEQKIVQYAQETGGQLLSIGATRPICSNCSSAISGVSGQPITPLK
jgi:hypothetical protein